MEQNEKKNVPYEDLDLIMGEMNRLEKLIGDSEALSEVGRAYLEELMKSIRGEIKSKMFYALMGYMVDSGRLKVQAPTPDEVPGEIEEVEEVVDESSRADENA